MNEKRQYTAQEKASALGLGLSIGARAASRKLEMPYKTLERWVYESRKSKKATSERPGDNRPAGPATRSPETSAPSATTRKAVAKVYTPSQRAQALEYADKHGPTLTAKELGISRFSLRDWRRKAAQHAKGERTDNPLAGSDENPATIRDSRILAEWRAHPGLGPTQIRNQLRRGGFKVSTHTVRCVLDANGYVAPRSRRQEAHDNFYEAVRPNQLWHLDFLHRHIHKQPVYTLLIVDDFSRFIVGGAIWDGERAAAVIETFSDAIARHGCPKMAMSDGGSAFYAWRGVSQFTGLLDELEIDQLIATQPQTNGKLEVLTGC